MIVCLTCCKSPCSFWRLNQIPSFPFCCVLILLIDRLIKVSKSSCPVILKKLKKISLDATFIECDVSLDYNRIWWFDRCSLLQIKLLPSTQNSIYYKHRIKIHFLLINLISGNIFKNKIGPQQSTLKTIFFNQTQSYTAYNKKYKST